ncbi:MAG: glycosyltransferase [Acidimicrobiales bacterium]
MTTVAVLSLHSSPLALPGVGDSGGMNVYVRELVSSLAQAGVASTVYVRRWSDDLPAVVEVEPGFSVVHVDAGPVDLPKEKLESIVDEFVDGVRAHLVTAEPVDLIHANYWLSGLAGHRLKHEFELPLVSTFHTLARVKAITGDPEPEHRIEAEAEVIGCSDVILASGVAEADDLVAHYGARRDRIEIVPPGVDHAFFAPGDRAGARAALGLGDGRVLLFVGRIQPLKRLTLAVEVLALLDDPDAALVVVGGPSGTQGEAELAEALAIASARACATGCVIPPQPHHLLSTYYRAADVVLVPSRSESFGGRAGGRRLRHPGGGRCGRRVDDHRRARPDRASLVEGDGADAYAAAVAPILADPARAAELGAAAARRASTYTWSTTAGRLRRVYADLAARSPVRCG